MDNTNFTFAEQTMTMLCFSAYCEFYSDAPAKLKKAIDSALKKLEAFGVKQQLTWGPAIHKPTFGLFTDALMFVVRDSQNPRQYTVVIRGTNPISIITWLFQNFDVKEMKPWNGHPGDKRLISDGMAESLLIHREKTIPAKFIPGQGKNIFTYLQSIIAESSGPTTIQFTGHSLGGLMASTLGLWIKENLPPDLAHKTKIKVFSFAGPTAGNREFAEHSDNVFKEDCMRYANPLDVAVRAWNIDSLNEIKTIYQKYWKREPLLKLLLYMITSAVKDKNYTQLARMTPIESQIVPDIFFFIVQAACQHIFPYITGILDKEIQPKFLVCLKDCLVPMIKISALTDKEKAFIDQQFNLIASS